MTSILKITRIQFVRQLFCDQRVTFFRSEKNGNTTLLIICVCRYTSWLCKRQMDSLALTRPPLTKKSTHHLMMCFFVHLFCDSLKFVTKLTIFFEPSATAALGRPYTPCPKHGAVVLLKDAMSAWPRWNGVVKEWTSWRGFCSFVIRLMEGRHLDNPLISC